jgi:hypothetical protein
MLTELCALWRAASFSASSIDPTSFQGSDLEFNR